MVHCGNGVLGSHVDIVRHGINIAHESVPQVELWRSDLLVSVLELDGSGHVIPACKGATPNPLFPGGGHCSWLKLAEAGKTTLLPHCRTEGCRRTLMVST